MPDIGLAEMLVIGVVALIVVGPKDLPMMFRRFGEFTGRMRRMARDFQRAMDDAADESGMSDVQRSLKGLTNPKKFGLDAVKDAAGDLSAWEPDEATGPATKELAAKRRAQRDHIREHSAKVAQARLDREAADAAEASAEPDLVPDPHAPEPAAAPATAAEPAAEPVRKEA